MERNQVLVSGLLSQVPGPEPQVDHNHTFRHITTDFTVPCGDRVVIFTYTWPIWREICPLLAVVPNLIHASGIHGPITVSQLSTDYPSRSVPGSQIRTVNDLYSTSRSLMAMGNGNDGWSYQHIRNSHMVDRWDILDHPVMPQGAFLYRP
jgi:hypothetical protein